MKPTLKNLLSLIFLTALLSACASNQGGSVLESSNADVSGATSTDSCRDSLGLQAREAVCRLVNEQRKAQGLGPLTLEANRSKVAQAFAEEMVSRGFFAHASPDGTTPEDRLRAAGLSMNAWGENIAAGQQTPQAVMQSWMGSSGHRANILNGAYRRMGVGLYQNHWVQTFTD